MILLLVAGFIAVVLIMIFIFRHVGAKEPQMEPTIMPTSLKELRNGEFFIQTNNGTYLYCPHNAPGVIVRGRKDKKTRFVLNGSDTEYTIMFGGYYLGMEEFQIDGQTERSVRLLPQTFYWRIESLEQGVFSISTTLQDKTIFLSVIDHSPVYYVTGVTREEDAANIQVFTRFSLEV